jgi:hypothetical protein
MQLSPRLVYDWNARLAACPHRPECARGKCDVAIPIGRGLSMFEEKVTNDEASIFLPLDAAPRSDIAGMSVAETDTAAVWHRLSSGVAALPGNYPRRRALAVFAETGSIQNAADEARVTYKVARGAIDRLCGRLGIDRSRLISRGPRPTRDTRFDEPGRARTLTRAEIASLAYTPPNRGKHGADSHPPSCSDRPQLPRRKLRSVLQAFSLLLRRVYGRPAKAHRAVAVAVAGPDRGARRRS